MLITKFEAKDYVILSSLKKLSTIKKFFGNYLLKINF